MRAYAWRYFTAADHDVRRIAKKRDPLHHSRAVIRLVVCTRDFVAQIDALRPKEQLRRHSRLPFVAALRDEWAQWRGHQHLIPGLVAVSFNLRRNKIRGAKEISGDAVRRAQVKIGRRPNFEQR